MTTTELVGPGEAFPSLRQMPTAELRAALAQAIQLTAERLARMAEIWAELERRGEDLSDLRRGIGAYLPMVAAGHLAAEAVVAFAGNKTLLRALATLPMAEQRRIAAGGDLPVVVDLGGEPIVRSLAATQLPARLIPKVFADGRVRTAQEQTALLGLTPDDRTLQRQRPSGEAHLSKDRQYLIVGRRKVPTTRVIELISEFRGGLPDISDDDEARSTVPVLMSAAEHRALKIAAARSGRSMTSLMRAALAAAGLTTIDE